MDVLGVDIGGVIIGTVNYQTDTSFRSINYLETAATPQVFESLYLLNQHKFGDNMFVVSYSGQATQDKSLAWLAHHRFYERTGIALERVRFCRKRSDKAIIAREVGITHFIDDKLEVLSYLSAVPHRYLYRPIPREIRRYEQHLPAVRMFNDWPLLAQYIITGA